MFKKSKCMVPAHPCWKKGHAWYRYLLIPYGNSMISSWNSDCFPLRSPSPPSMAYKHSEKPMCKAPVCGGCDPQKKENAII
jgi:hypothetical protein